MDQLKKTLKEKYFYEQQFLFYFEHEIFGHEIVEDYGYQGSKDHCRYFRPNRPLINSNKTVSNWSLDPCLYCY